jgi:hypothetical protein
MNELEVRISPLKSEIVADEVLQLRVQVWNTVTKHSMFAEISMPELSTLGHAI